MDRHPPEPREQRRASSLSAGLGELDLGGLWALDRFQLRRVLSVGPHGVVWLGRERDTRRRVAIKVAPPEHAARLLREARALEPLDHPHVMQYVADGPFEIPGEGPAKGACLVLDYVDGVRLSKVLQVTTPRAPRAIAWAAQLADALVHAHQRGVLHGDVGPQRVLVARDERGRERLVLAGFGAVVGDEGGLSLDADRTVSPHGQAPEWASGAPVDARTDVYALGATLYRLLAGAVPFQGIPPGPALDAAHQHHDVPPLGEHRPMMRLPDGLERVVMGCLQKRAEDRLASAVEVRDQLRAMQYTPQRDWVRVCGLEQTLPPTDRTSATGRPWASPSMPAAALGLAAVAVLMGVWSLWG